MWVWVEGMSSRREDRCGLQRQDGETGQWMASLGSTSLVSPSYRATLCSSLQLNSLGPEACRDLRELLLHGQCQVTTLR